MKAWNWRAIAVTAPAGVLAAGLAVALVLSAIGRNPIWPDHDLTLSEAVAAEDDAEIEQLIGYGADPNAAYDIRAGLLFDRPARLTPLETAVVSDRTELIERLVHHGVVIDAVVWNRVACLADDDAISAVLDQYRPADAQRHCEAVSAP